MLLAKANRNSCLKAAQFFHFPGGPLPLPYCGFSKSSFPSSNPPLNSLHSLSADYLGRYLTEQIDSIYRNSFKFLPVSRHTILCHLGVELGRRAKRLIFQDPPPLPQSSFLRALAQTCLFFLDTSSASYSSSTPFSQHVNLIPSLPED